MHYWPEDGGNWDRKFLSAAIFMRLSNPTCVVEREATTTIRGRIVSLLILHLEFQNSKLRFDDFGGFEWARLKLLILMASKLEIAIQIKTRLLSNPCGHS